MLRLNTMFCLFIVVIAEISGPSIAIANNTEHRFSQIKKNPETLQTFLKQMPKGADLHAHFDGSMNLDTLLNLAEQDKLCIQEKTLTISPTSTCHTALLQDFLKNKHHQKALYHAWSMRGLSINDPVRYDHFFGIFSKISWLYQKYSQQILVHLIRQAAAQHLLYLEMIRMHNADNARFIPLIANQQSYHDKKQALLADPVVQQRIQQQIDLAAHHLKRAYNQIGCEKNSHQLACHVTVRFQYFVLRAKPLDEMFIDALMGFEVASRSPLVVGVNLVQPEKAPLAAQYFKQQMDIFAYLHQQYPNVQVSLHAGELTHEMTHNPGLKNHIRNSIEHAHAKRIGHGTALFDEAHYEDLVKKMADEHIAVEINLKSNQDILRISGKHHPFLYYLTHQVPVVLSTDDAGLSETDLTTEYVRATQRYNLDYQTIKQINRNGLTYSFLKGQSIWSDAEHAVFVPECQYLSSQRCLQWIEKSEKAQLQWKLEKKLTEFEAYWTP